MKKNNGKQTKKYSPKYFKEGLPEWKRIKDPITSRVFYRPISFVTSSIATKIGFSANDVSYISIIIAIFAFVTLLVPNHLVNIIGAILVNIWLISDCTDGNIARSVKKQPFGDFADSVSSYILVAFLGIGLGLVTYFQGGLLVEKNNIWIMLFGAVASISDTLMRLVYQKYKNSERNLVDQGLITTSYDKRTDESQVNSLLVRIESDFGVSGLVPIITLLGVIFNATDLVVFYFILYYFLSSIVMICKYIFKAVRITKEIERRK